MSSGDRQDNEARTRAFRDILQGKDYPMKYIEVPFGHIVAPANLFPYVAHAWLPGREDGKRHHVPCQCRGVPKPRVARYPTDYSQLVTG